VSRATTIGMFTAMKALADKGDCESLKLIIDETLAAAKGESQKPEASPKSDKSEN